MLRIVAPIIHCVRHAQGFHNLSIGNHSMHDPNLTPFGEQQSRTLANRFPYHNNIDLLVASPLRRTIYTTLLAFESEVKRGLKLIALPEFQETSDVPCDTGSDVEVLRKEMKGKPVDLSLVQQGWNSKKGKWAPASDAIEARAREARQWLKARPEKEIVVVTHGGFLHYFTEDWTDSGKFWGTGWANTEYRSYHFADEAGENASLVETTRSREARRGTEKPATKAERIALENTATHFKEVPEVNGAHNMQTEV